MQVELKSVTVLSTLLRQTHTHTHTHMRAPRRYIGLTQKPPRLAACTTKTNPTPPTTAATTSHQKHQHQHHVPLPAAALLCLCSSAPPLLCCSARPPVRSSAPRLPAPCACACACCCRCLLLLHATTTTPSDPAGPGSVCATHCSTGDSPACPARAIHWMMGAGGGDGPSFGIGLGPAFSHRPLTPKAEV